MEEDTEDEDHQHQLAGYVVQAAGNVENDFQEDGLAITTFFVPILV